MDHTPIINTLKLNDIVFTDVTYKTLQYTMCQTANVEALGPYITLHSTTMGPGKLFQRRKNAGMLTKRNRHTQTSGTRLS